MKEPHINFVKETSWRESMFNSKDSIVVQMPLHVLTEDAKNARVFYQAKMKQIETESFALRKAEQANVNAAYEAKKAAWARYWYFFGFAWVIFMIFVRQTPIKRHVRLPHMNVYLSYDYRWSGKNVMAREYQRLKNMLTILDDVDTLSNNMNRSLSVYVPQRIVEAISILDEEAT
jgi:hypothetical protein